jgi:hypothetical protein
MRSEHTMAFGQNQKGTTVNASIGVSASGVFTYTFNDPFNMLVNLTKSTGIAVNGGNLNDQFNLQNATGVTINGGNGNDTFSVSAAVGNLNANIIRGGSGINLVQFNGSGSDIDLTGLSQGTAAASNIEIVVGRAGLTGNSVEVNLNQLATSSLKSSAGKAFVAVIGRDGQVNVTEPGKFQLVGEVDANGVGYDASGAVLTDGALASLTSKVTWVVNVEGSVAADFAGSKDKQLAPGQTYLPGALSAYVFSDGATNSTVWSDGVVNATSATNSTTAYQPAVVTLATQPTLGTFGQFHMSDPDPNYKYAVGTLGVNPAGLTTLLLASGQSLAFAAVLANGVSGTVIRGTAGAKSGGPNGGNWFGLGPSGGGNTIIGAAVGDIFDLQNASAMVDILKGSTGFDVVRAKGAAGVDVDLTSGNGTTGIASRFIDAVVGNKAATDTVEVDLGTLNVTDTSGVKQSVFEAMFGSSNSTLTLSAATGTFWKEVTTFAPGAAPPPNAEALYDPSMLDAVYGIGTYKAENSLTGYLFEQVNSKGVALKYVTIYTDGTLASNLAAPAAAMTHAMAQMGASSAASSASTAAAPNLSLLTLASPNA